MLYGPCVLCGATNYPNSLGGPSICPSCDCGNVKPKTLDVAYWSNTFKIEPYSDFFFEKLACLDLRHLASHIHDSFLNSGLRARAAQAAGLSRDSVAVRGLLLPLLGQAEPIVQEGAIYGLTHHLDDSVLARLRELVEDEETSWGVREAARDILEKSSS